jgi:hypothetical protein
LQGRRRAPPRWDPGGVAGANGAYPIERIDRQLVEEEVLKLVEAVMGS